MSTFKMFSTNMIQSSLLIILFTGYLTDAEVRQNKQEKTSGKPSARVVAEDLAGVTGSDSEEVLPARDVYEKPPSVPRLRKSKSSRKSSLRSLSEKKSMEELDHEMDGSDEFSVENPKDPRNTKDSSSSNPNANKSPLKWVFVKSDPACTGVPPCPKPADGTPSPFNCPTSGGSSSSSSSGAGSSSYSYSSKTNNKSRSLSSSASSSPDGSLRSGPLLSGKEGNGDFKADEKAELRRLKKEKKRERKSRGQQRSLRRSRS